MADDIRIVISADDRSQRELEELGRRLSGLDQQARRTKTGFEMMGDGGVRAFTAVERGYGIMTRLDLVQITVQQSAERVQQAQEGVNDAVARFGPNSQQAIQASRELDAAQQNLEKANLRAKLSMVLVTGDVIQLAAQAPRAIAALHGMATAARAAAVAHGALAVTVTGGLAVAGIVAGVLAVNAAIDGMATSAKGATSDLAPLENRISSLRLEAEALRAEIEKGDFEGRRGDQDKRWREAMEEQTELLTRIRDIEAQLASERASNAAAYIAQAEQRRIIESGTVEELTAARKQAADELAHLDAEMRIGLDTDEFEETKREMAALDALLGSIDTALGKHADAQAKAAKDAADAAKDAARDAAESARLMAAEWENSLDMVSGHLQAVGIDFRDFSLDTLTSAVATSGGAFVELARRAIGLNQQEDEIAKHAFQASKALRDQASITARKGETTEQFTQRLREMGFTEEEVTSRLDESGRALLSQREAVQGLSADLLTFAQIRDRVTQDVAGVNGLPGVTREQQVFASSGSGWISAFLSELRPDLQRPGSFTIDRDQPRGRVDSEARVGTIIVQNYLQPGEGTVDGVTSATIRGADTAARRLASRGTY